MSKKALSSLCGGPALDIAKGLSLLRPNLKDKLWGCKLPPVITFTPYKWSVVITDDALREKSDKLTIHDIEHDQRIYWQVLGFGSWQKFHKELMGNKNFKPSDTLLNAFKARAVKLWIVEKNALYPKNELYSFYKFDPKKGVFVSN